ncbi:hypothetical protein EIP91_010200 [Steccherinum ochraceum]|uniref:EF-hand domain-containing protein n=1 Tax=Steccherinum ochraceum TaxID=92696 RepID=A0A4R0RIS3_9APHY|nr:hypothetical protein EIP91_000233 [Steccherinum ochraceum]TCD68678.1 hypothetical protein EIP91_010200 [Steccherinum ochraceum]
MSTTHPTPTTDKLHKRFSLRTILHLKSDARPRTSSDASAPPVAFRSRIFPRPRAQSLDHVADGAPRVNGRRASTSGSSAVDGESKELPLRPTSSVYKDLPSLPNGVQDIVATAVPVPESVPVPSSVEEDGLEGLAKEGIVEKVGLGPNSTRAEDALNNFDDAVGTTTNPDGAVAKYVTPIKTILDASGATEAIHSGLDSLMENIPWLMKGLDEVARIHPVVTVAVLAFKAVYNMELTRRENDRRILSLYVEMKDMITVLIQLRDVRDPEDVGLDGKPISARLQGLAKQTADDIKNCANACDTYSKKRLLVKVLKGYVWEERLVEFVGTFQQRKTEFEQALTMHIARTVERMDRTLAGVKITADAINERVALFMRVFETFVPSAEAELRDLVNQKGDPKTVQNNETLLLELSEQETRLDPRRNTGRGIRTNTIKDLKEELRLDLDVALQKNLETFDGKFELYHRQLREELAQFIHEENNQLLTAMREGPHDRIENEELRGIWKEMNWRRNVKSRLFVMTLRDHFRERVEDIKHSRVFGDPPSNLQRVDAWALQFVSVPWLQPIMEAFDDDGSGYITISEVNAFTRALPVSLGWSLQHWIAYWAVGWRLTTAQYREQIHGIFAQMFALRSKLLPENRQGADFYLNKVWQSTVELTLAFKVDDLPSDVQISRILPYAQYEEERIRRNLLDIRYDIDALDTVYVVAGKDSERLEKYVLILIYLLLRRDLEIFTFAQTNPLHPDELPNSAASLEWVFDAAVFRVRDLTEFYRQHKLNVGTQFETVASGLFTYYNDSRPLWSMNTYEDPPFGSSREQELKDHHTGPPLPSPFSPAISVPRSFLTYKPPEGLPFITSGYEAPTLAFSPPDENAAATLKSILGQWNGFLYTESEYPYSPMTSFTFLQSQASSQAFGGTGRHFSNEEFMIRGTCHQDERGVVHVRFHLSYAISGEEYYVGHVDPTGALVGYHSWDQDISESKHTDRFILKQVSQEIMSQRPSPSSLLQEGKARHWWHFATSCVLTEVRRRSWNWSYFQGRRRVRKRYLELNLRLYEYGRPLDEDENEEYLLLRRSLTPADALYYRSLGDYILHIIPEHYRGLGGPRLMCLDCPPPSAEDFTDTIDFCDLVCAQTVVTHAERSYLEDGNPHTTEHSLLKIRTVLNFRDMPDLRKKAQEALQVAYDRLDGTPPRSSAGDFPMPSPCCAVCQAELQLPCWFCVDCSGTFICDSCESSTLLACMSCAQPYCQPTWYYGEDSRDTFTCNRCSVKGIKPYIEPASKHVYTHPLVRVSSRPRADGDALSLGTDDRLLALERRVEDMDAKLDRLENRLGGELLKINQTLESVQQALQLIVSRVAKADA